MEDYPRYREIKTIVRNEDSNWCKVMSGVPQESLLAPVIFTIYINEIVQGVNSYLQIKLSYQT